MVTAPIAQNLSRTFPVVIAELAERFGDAPALISEANVLSFRSLDALANRYAHWARMAGIGHGDTVGLLMGNRPEYLAIWVGIARAGAATALLSTSLRGTSLAHCINQVAPKHIIAAPELIKPLTEAMAEVAGDPQISIDFIGGARSAGVAAINGSSSASPDTELPCSNDITIDDPALYIYTSGTTGLPKAAVITHRRLMMWTHWFAGMMDTSPADRMYNCLPMYHSVGGAVATGAALVNGGSVVIREKFSASEFWAEIVRFECSLFQYIGELCRYLVQGPTHPCERTHRLRMACGNGLRADVWDTFKRRFGIPQILEFYASTEGNVSLFNVEGQPGSIGRFPPFIAHRSPLALVQFDAANDRPLRDQDGFCVRCGSNEIGEALGRIGKTRDGSVRFDGYTVAAETRKKILYDVFERGDLWYRTGDLMRCDESSFYYFIDRVGDSYRWKGENVATSEVATALTAYCGIIDANVHGVAVAGNDGRAGLAEIVCSESFDIAGLPRHLQDRLPRYAHPVFLRLRDAVETTPTFKRKQPPGPFASCGLDDNCGSLFVLDSRHECYVRLDRTLYAHIAQGSFRL